MKEKILHILNEKSDFISGEEISKLIGVSRTAIWKHINGLKEEGYIIESISRKGYKLIKSPDILTEEEISKYLDTRFIGKSIKYFESINSTNTKAKELADFGAPDGTVIISEEQLSGKGRLGRNWISPKYKGIWMSIILRPEIDPRLIAKITQVGAAAIVMAGDELGLKMYIKWPNDIIINDKKICGILTEMSSELNQINYVVLGMGINANLDVEDFDEELIEKASSIKIETNAPINRKELCGKILNNFENLYEKFMNDESGIESINICRQRSILINKDINVIKGNEIYKAYVVDLNNEGELVVRKEDGTFERLFSGEVSIRGRNGYVI